MLDRIGRYQITGELGSGAMGVVYRATDPTIGRTVALKTIRTELIGQAGGTSLDQLAERFRNEARAAGALNHRNIVTIYDAGEDQGTFFIAMEYLEGATLQQLIAQRRCLPPAEAVELGTQLCAGLDYAHQRGIIHRDIKPANIIVTSDGTAKITDFGIAKAEQALAAQLTLTGQVLGTPDYMSPEQVRGTSIDARTDLFSLGVVLYQMVTGERPFPGESLATVIYKIVHENPAAPHALNASVPEGLSAVITRALAKSPEARFPTARAMGDALRQYRESVAGYAPTVEIRSYREPAKTETREQSAREPIGRKLRRRIRERYGERRSRVWPGIGILIAAAILLISNAHKREQKPAPSPNTTQSSTASPAPTPSSSGQAQQPRNNSPEPNEPPTPTVPAVPSTDEIMRQTGKLEQQITKSVGSEVSDATKASLAYMSGELHVTSKPSGATVSVDAKSNGWKTPANIPAVSAGEHNVFVTKPGYKALSVTAPVVPGYGGAINAILEPEGSSKASSAEIARPEASTKRDAATATGTVVITSNPSGANIILEQYGNGRTTPARLTIPAGRHELVLTKQGYLPATQSIEVKAGRTTEIKANLPRVPSRP